VFLNQHFRKAPSRLAPHEVEFPYFLQSYGCFHDLFSLPVNTPRAGVFLEHHSAAQLDPERVRRLETFGPVEGSTTSDQPRTMTPEELVTGLARSKYFVKVGRGRVVWGNAAVEAISAGCLALGEPEINNHGFLYGQHCVARSFDEVLGRLAAFEQDPGLYRREVERQRALVDHLCYVRPTLDLFAKAEEVLQRRK
jgi:hypothetical protein